MFPTEQAWPTKISLAGHDTTQLLGSNTVQTPCSILTSVSSDYQHLPHRHRTLERITAAPEIPLATRSQSTQLPENHSLLSVTTLESLAFSGVASRQTPWEEAGLIGLAPWPVSHRPTSPFPDSAATRKMQSHEREMLWHLVNFNPRRRQRPSAWAIMHPSYKYSMPAL